MLHVTQQRLREKTFLSGNGFPVTPFRAVRSEQDLRAATLRGAVATASMIMSSEVVVRLGQPLWLPLFNLWVAGACKGRPYVTSFGCRP